MLVKVGLSPLVEDIFESTIFQPSVKVRSKSKLCTSGSPFSFSVVIVAMSVKEKEFSTYHHVNNCVFDSPGGEKVI